MQPFHVFLESNVVSDREIKERLTDYKASNTGIAAKKPQNVKLRCFTHKSAQSAQNQCSRGIVLNNDQKRVSEECRTWWCHSEDDLQPWGYKMSSFPVLIYKVCKNVVELGLWLQIC